MSIRKHGEGEVLAVEDTAPVELIEVDDDGPAPPPEWDAGAHDDDDVTPGVEVTED